MGGGSASNGLHSFLNVSSASLFAFSGRLGRGTPKGWSDEVWSSDVLTGPSDGRPGGPPLMGDADWRMFCGEDWLVLWGLPGKPGGRPLPTKPIVGGKVLLSGCPLDADCCWWPEKPKKLANLSLASSAEALMKAQVARAAGRGYRTRCSIFTLVESRGIVVHSIPCGPIQILERYGQQGSPQHKVKRQTYPDSSYFGGGAGGTLTSSHVLDTPTILPILNVMKALRAMAFWTIRVVSSEDEGE